MDSSRQARFDEMARHLGHSFDGPIRIGGDDEPVVRHAARIGVMRALTLLRQSLGDLDLVVAAD